MLHGVSAFVGGDGRGGDARRRIDRIAQVDGHRLGIEVVGEVSPDVGDLHVVDVVLAQHLLGDLGAGQPAGELNLRVFLEDRLQTRLDDVSGDADGDNQQEHAHRGGVVACGVRFGVIACLEQAEEQKCHCVFGFAFLLFAVRVIRPRLLRGHQHHFINVHVGR